MRIVVLENEPSSLRGGQELSLLEVCEGLHKKGHAITLLHTQDGDLLDDYRRITESVVKVNAYHIMPKIDPRAWAKFIADVARVRVSDDTVVYSNQYHDTLFGSALSVMRRVPFVCQLRLSPPAYFCGQWKIGLKAVKRFIAISERTRQEWIQKGIEPRRIERVYNGVDTEKFKISDDPTRARSLWGLSGNDFVVSFVGRLDKDKGLETLIEAAALLSGSCPDLKILIAGKPHDHATHELGARYKSSLVALVHELGLSERVRFLGHVADARSVYHASDALVLPTRIHEAFGRVMIEAMACGVPAVGSRAGGIPEILTGEFSKFCFTPALAQELSECLMNIRRLKDSDPGLRSRCRAHVLSQFKLEDAINGIEKVLKGSF